MSDLRVSDHAMLRFLERGGEFDMEELRSRIERSLIRAHSAARSMGQADYIIRIEGMVFVVRGDVVTTCMNQEPAPQRAKALAREGHEQG